MTPRTAPVPGAVAARPAGIARWLPGVAVLRAYRREWLSRDLVAGLVLSALLVPQGMAYAELAGLPPITGLYATVVCLVAYAAVGPSPVLVLGPDSALGAMIAAVVLPLAAGNPDQAVALAGTLALLVGLVCVAAGVLRLGFVADLLSRPIRVGYLAGLALTIVVGQLPKLLGFSIDADGLLRELAATWQSRGQTNPYALAIGLVDLALILGLKRRRSRIPGVLAAVLVSILAVNVFDLTARGVQVVGGLPQGFPAPGLPAVDLATLPLLLAAAVGISLVAIGDTIATSTGFAARRGQEVDSNQELAGIGAANLLCGLFQGFPVSTSGSRTAGAEQSGAMTQLAGLVAAGSVLAMLLFVPNLVQNLPQPALAALVIAAGLSLFDVAELRRLLAMRRTEFALAVACALGVALAGVLAGIVIAVGLAILQFFARAWRPYSAELGRPAGVAGFHDLTRYPDAARIPGLLILRWDAPLFFANAGMFRDTVRQRLAESAPAPRWVLLAAEPITDVDTTAADVLVDLDEELNARDVHLAFAGLKDPVKDKLVRYGLLDTIDHRHFFPTLDVAVEAFEAFGRPDGTAAEPIGSGP
jgi:high affinity sulfate transporter 1